MNKIMRIPMAWIGVWLMFASLHAEETVDLRKETCGKIGPLHVLGGLYLAGQPTGDDWIAVKKAGIKTVINLRPSSELNFDEAAEVKKQGLEYVAIPFRSAESLTDEVFDQVRKLLSDKERQPLLMHCGSANRVAAVWLAHRVLDDGVKLDVALAEAKQVGLRSAELEAKAKDYIQRKSK